MTCYSPWRCFLGFGGVGVATLSRSPSKASIVLPCRRCIGCRLDGAREWGLRIQHEASLHEENSFITLTYRDIDLPYDGGLSLRELQLFFKRLRERVDVPLRYYACGEYGDDKGRPHYHAVVFGYGFPDKKVWRKTSTGNLTYRSALLESVWPFGHSEVGTVTRASGAYVAAYVLKKIGGALAEEYYTRPHPVTGEVYRVAEEFATMSSRPGIGAGWFDKYHSDCFPSGYLICEGRKVRVPHYYRSRSAYFASITPSKKRAREYSRAHAEDLTDERLAVRGEVQVLKQERFKRNLGEG